MKIIINTFNFIVLFTFIIGFGHSLKGQSSQNYIKEYSARQPINTDLKDKTKDQVNVSTTFYDGLGRPLQTVIKEGSPSGKDIVILKELNGLGLLEKEYLPFVSTEVNGEYKAISGSDINAFYDGTDAEGNPIASTGNAYSQIRYEPIPLNRVIEQASPGNDWKISSGKTVRSAYKINEAGDNVIKWVFDGRLIKDGHYESGSLFKNETLDEDDNKVVEFKNGFGQTILKRAYESSSNYFDTYYVYDLKDNLAMVLPPEFTEQENSEIWSGQGHYVTGDEYVYGDISLTSIRDYVIGAGGSLTLTNATITATDQLNFSARALKTTPSQTYIDRFAFQYEYDGRNRMVGKKVPGADKWVHMVYDDRDRLVLTQDGNQRNAGQWAYTKYDALNRPVITGILNSGNNRVEMETAIESYYSAYEVTDAKYYEERGTDLYEYTNRSFPSGASTANVLTVTYYDEDFTLTNNSDYNFSYSYTADNAFGGKSNSTRGLTTGGYTRVLNPDGTYGEMLAHKNYYDSRQRLIQSVTDHHLGNRLRTSMAYDFVGNTIKTKEEYYGVGGTTQTVLTTNTYDHADRLLTSTTTIDGREKELVANTYNEVGELVTKEMGGNVQKVDYAYNARGWLATINGGTSFDDPNDKFGMALKYGSAGEAGHTYYNGNIGGMEWKNNSSQKYDFSYDGVNRLKLAEYNMGWGNQHDQTVDNIAYDANGNIETLRRKRNGGYIDNLTYDYDGNQLTRVEDSYGNDGFEDVNSSAGTREYTYDANGNMITDSNKEITKIEYNYLNLPRLVEDTDGNSVEYTYDAAGTKLKKKAYNGEGISTTDYIGALHLVDGNLDFMMHPEGRYDYATNEYHFNLTDHLGNVRVVVDEAGAVVQRDDYYPFGLTFNSYQRSYSKANNFKYNGKEEQEETGWLDYGARNYDAALGRFFNQDRFATKYFSLSPYQYAANDPIRNIDVNGDSINVSNLITQNGKLNTEGLYVLFNMVSDLSDATGLNFSVNGSGNLVSDGKINKDKNGNQIGSKSARKYVNGLIGSTRDINVTNDNSKSTQGGGIGSVNINSDQIDNNIASMQSAGLGELAFGYGMSFLHESMHTATGTLVMNPSATTAIGDPPPTTPNAQGPTVTNVNVFRNELGLPERSHYFWQQTSSTAPKTMKWSQGGTTTTVTQGTMTPAVKQQRRGIINAILNFRWP